jgi:hypothetical protein
MAFRTSEHDSITASIFLEPPPESLKDQQTERLCMTNSNSFPTDPHTCSSAKDGCTGDFLINFSSSLSITPKASSNVSTATPNSTSPLRHRSGVVVGLLEDIQTQLQFEIDHSLLAEESPLALKTPVKSTTTTTANTDTLQIKMHSEVPTTNNPR